MFIEALFTIAKIWNQLKSPSAQDEWIKKAVIHLYNKILLSYKKEGNLTLCDSVDGPGQHYAK